MLYQLATALLAAENTPVQQFLSVKIPLPYREITLCRTLKEPLSA